MANLTITTEDGEITIEGVELEEGVKFSNIGQDQTWTITTIDDSPATYTSDHVGGRPDDRS